jgi:hypothetical protein
MAVACCVVGISSTFIAAKYIQTKIPLPYHRNHFLIIGISCTCFLNEQEGLAPLLEFIKKDPKERIQTRE